MVAKRLGTPRASANESSADLRRRAAGYGTAPVPCGPRLIAKREQLQTITAAVRRQPRASTRISRTRIPSQTPERPAAAPRMTRGAGGGSKREKRGQHAVEALGTVADEKLEEAGIVEPRGRLVRQALHPRIGRVNVFEAEPPGRPPARDSRGRPDIRVLPSAQGAGAPRTPTRWGDPWRRSFDARGARTRARLSQCCCGCKP